MAKEIVNVVLRVGVEEKLGPFYGQVARIAAQAQTAIDRFEALGSRMVAAARQTDAFESGLKRVGATIGAVFAVQRIHEFEKALVNTMSRFEQLQLGIAGAISGTGGASFVKAQEISDLRIKNLMEAAAKQVGTNEDYWSTFQRVLAPVRVAGGTSAVAEELTRKLVPVAMTMEGREGLGLLGYQITEVLQRGLTPRLAPMLQRIIREGGGAHAFEKFNVSTPTEKIAMLIKAADAFKDMVKAGERTYETQASTLESNILLLKRAGGQPFFDQLKRSLADTNAWIERNRPQLEGIAKGFGQSIADAFRIVGQTMRFAVEHKEALLAVGGAITAARIATAMQGGGGLRGLPVLGALFGNLGAGIGNAALSMQLASGFGATALAAVRMAGALTGAAAAIGGLTYAAYKFGEWIAQQRLNAQERFDTERAEQFRRNAAREAMERRLGGTSTIAALEDVRAHGAKSRFLSDLRLGFAQGAFSDTAQTAENHRKFAPLLGDAIVKKLLTEPKEKKMHGAGELNMNVQIKMDVRDVRDPDRIATMTSEKLAQLLRAPLQSKRALAVGGF